MMNRKNNLVLIICTLFTLMTFAHAQETFEKPQARLVDEFDNASDVSSTVARLDAFAVAMQNEPNSRAYIVSYRNYEQLRGKTFRTLNWIKLFLTTDRRLEPERIILIDGGETSVSSTQLWIVPEGETPKIKDTFRKTFEDTNSARKFDDYYFSFDKLFIDITTGYGRYFVNSLEAFEAAIVKENGATAFIIIYPELSDRQIVFARMAQRVKSDLTKKYELPLSKLKIVNGGFRRQRSVELWILPKGEHAPVATPNAFPKIRKKRPQQKTRIKK